MELDSCREIRERWTTGKTKVECEEGEDRGREQVAE